MTRKSIHVMTSYDMKNSLRSAAKCYYPFVNISISDRRPTTYLQAKEGIPIVKGNVVAMSGPETRHDGNAWARWAAISIFPISNRPTPMCARLLPAARRCRNGICFEEIIYVAKGRGATSVWQEDGGKVTFEWAQGAIFAIPLNASYIHFNGSRDEPVRLFAGTTCPRMINIFHNEDFIFRNPFNFRDRFHEGDEFCATTSTWQSATGKPIWCRTSINFALDDFPMKGKGVKHMRFTSPIPPTAVTSRSFRRAAAAPFIATARGAVIIITQGEGYVVLWKDGEERQLDRFKVGTVYSPDDLMWHGHFNTGRVPCATSPCAAIARNTATTGFAIRLDDDPDGRRAARYSPRVRRLLKEKGVETAVSVVED